MKNKKKLIIICSVILAATAVIMICLLTLGKNDKINEEKNPEISEEEIVKKGLDEFVEILNNNDDVYDFCDEYRTMMGATLNWKEEKYNMFSDFEGVLYACLYDTNYEYVSNDFGGMFLASKEEHENMMGYFTDDKLTKFIDSEDYNYCVNESGCYGEDLTKAKKLAEEGYYYAYAIPGGGYEYNIDFKYNNFQKENDYYTADVKINVGCPTDESYHSYDGKIKLRVYNNHIVYDSLYRN